MLLAAIMPTQMAVTEATEKRAVLPEAQAVLPDIPEAMQAVQAVTDRPIIPARKQLTREKAEKQALSEYTEVTRIEI